jgi:nuclear cap-binding protein subunit 1
MGLELVKLILLTVAYTMASPATGLEERASGILEKTDIVASAPHLFEPLVNPYGTEPNAPQISSVIRLLSVQLQAEAKNGWPLACLPRPWKSGSAEEGLEGSTKHAMPAIQIPEAITPSSRPCLPEVYLSVYAEQDMETVPPTSTVASTIIRDAIVDTINVLDYNRNVAAQELIDIDRYFGADVFAKRATPFDKLKELEAGTSTWKPEDVAVDAVFSQLLRLPAPAHKLVYYHSLLTEVCKLAPAAIAPSLGRAIRFLYKGLEFMDLELDYRFIDWFAHHLSNFGFTWKWTEW